MASDKAEKRHGSAIGVAEGQMPIGKTLKCGKSKEVWASSASSKAPAEVDDFETSRAMRELPALYTGSMAKTATRLKLDESALRTCGSLQHVRKVQTVYFRKGDAQLFLAPLNRELFHGRQQIDSMIPERLSFPGENGHQAP